MSYITGKSKCDRELKGPSREAASLRTLVATEMTSGPIPSPGSRVMV